MLTTKSAAGAVLRYRFGPFEADLSQDELRKFGLRIRLEPKPWHLLVALLQRPGELVTRSELQRALWDQDVFVDFEHGLNVAVKKLRVAMSDSADGSTYIETVAGKGYRFVAKVEQVFTTNNTVASDRPKPTPVPLPPLPPSGIRQSWLQKHRPWRAVAVVVCVSLIAVAIARLSWRALKEPKPVHAGKVMLVVLPFENLSGDPSQEYFSDGVTEELSAQLGNLSPQRLAVIGRTSAMTYKHSHSTISQIGKDLGVDYVLEGSVRREADKLRVTAQLVHVSDQAHVWAEDYDRDARDLLRLEDEVAGRIAAQVRVSIVLDQPGRSLNRHNPDPEAHEEYLLGRYYWNKRTPEGWRMGAEHFRRAIEKDPQYSAAYAGLAESVRDTTATEAKQAAMKAIELDPTSGEARAALGWVELYKELDVVAAEDALKSAVQMDPNYAPAHHTYARLLSITGRVQQAIAEQKQATTLDPLFLIMRAALAAELSGAGQQDVAEKELKLVFEMDPHFPKAHEFLGDIYTRKNMYNEAIREYKTSVANGGDELWYSLGYVYALSGNKREALSILSKLEDLEKRSGGESWALAVVEIGLGNKDKALAWLEKTYQEHNDDGLLQLRYPIFDPLRSDPRFQNLLRRMKLGP